MIRNQLGDEVGILVQCYDASGNPVDPDDAPEVSVYASDDSEPVPPFKIPSQDYYQTTGLFQGFLWLGSNFSAGHYTVRIQWTTGAFTGVASQIFEVLPGGHADGAITSMHAIESGKDEIVVYGMDSGVIKEGKNPR